MYRVRDALRAQKVEGTVWRQSYQRRLASVNLSHIGEMPAKYR